MKTPTISKEEILIAYHLYGKTAYSGVNSSGNVHSGELFLDKMVIPSEVLLFSRFNINF